MKVTRNTQGSARLAQAIADLQSKKLKVGWFETAKYDDGTPVAYVATIQEFGSPENNIPSRPFMRPTAAENKTQWNQTLANGSKRVIDGKMSTTEMLGAFGKIVAGEIGATISTVTTPKLADATIKARERKRKSPGVSTKPLVDSGLMIQSVSAKVEG